MTAAVGEEASSRSPFTQLGDAATEDASVGRSQYLSSRCKVLGILFVVLLTIIVLERSKVVLLIHLFPGLLNKLLTWFQSWGILACPLVSLTCILCTLLWISTAPIFIGSGVLFERMYGVAGGTFLGVCSCFVGLWIGSMLAFGLGRTLFKPCVEGKIAASKPMKALNAVIEEEGWRFVFVARFSPFLPIEPFIYVCAVTSLSFSQHAVGLFGSLLPITFFVWTSASATYMEDQGGASNGRSQGQTIFLIIFNLLILVGMIALVKHSSRKYHAALEKQASEDTVA